MLSLAPGSGKKRDPGNEVGGREHEYASFSSISLNFLLFDLTVKTLDGITAYKGWREESGV